MTRIISLLFLGMSLVCQPVMALELSDAKVQGLVGETATGYLAPVASSAEVQQLVVTINNKRKEHYQNISRKNNTPLSTVEKLAGEKAMEKTPVGQFIQMNGAWKRK